MMMVTGVLPEADSYVFHSLWLENQLSSDFPREIFGLFKEVESLAEGEALRKFPDSSGDDPNSSSSSAVGVLDLFELCFCVACFALRSSSTFNRRQVFSSHWAIPSLISC